MNNNSVFAGTGTHSFPASRVGCPGLPYPLVDGVGLADGALGCGDAVGDAAIAFAQTPQLAAHFLQRGTFGGQAGGERQRNKTQIRIGLCQGGTSWVGHGGHGDTECLQHGGDNGRSNPASCSHPRATESCPLSPALHLQTKHKHLSKA